MDSDSTPKYRQDVGLLFLTARVLGRGMWKPAAEPQLMLRRLDGCLSNDKQGLLVRSETERATFA